MLIFLQLRHRNKGRTEMHYRLSYPRQPISDSWVFPYNTWLRRVHWITAMNKMAACSWDSASKHEDVKVFHSWLLVSFNSFFLSGGNLCVLSSVGIKPMWSYAQNSSINTHIANELNKNSYVWQTSIFKRYTHVQFGFSILELFASDLRKLC